ncbi:MAG: DUF1304 domain-containing protein [Micrococcales bacterium]|nr:DUF1304 domain-containing protein [Micrococcales bacterium]
MLLAGLVAAALAALLHVFIFYLESIAWTGPRARATFGTTVQEAEATREMAYNQGFYNFFLAILIAIGIGAYAAGLDSVGLALVLAGCGSMVAAALVLLLSSPDKRGAALKQITPGLLAVVLLIAGLAL